MSVPPGIREAEEVDKHTCEKVETVKNEGGGGCVSEERKSM